MADVSILVQAHERLGKLLPALMTVQRASWEQGCAAQALLEVSQAVPQWISRDTALRYLYGFAHDALVRQGRDGRLAVVLNGDGSSDPGAVDPACIGETFYYLLQIQETNTLTLSQDDISHFSVGVENMLHYILEQCPRAPVTPDSTSPSDILLSHRADCKQIWSDAVYMLPPFLMSAAIYYSPHLHPSFDASSLLSMSLRQIALAAKALQAPTGEWSHMFDLETYEFKRRAFWGVGNGWVCGGIVRVFSSLAAALSAENASALEALLRHPEVGELLQKCYNILRLTLDGCLPHLRPDGLFHDVLDDATTFVETNLSQQLSYTLFRLLDLHTHLPPPVQGLLRIPAIDTETRDKWQRLAVVMRDAALATTDQWGFVRDVCGSPRFNAAGTAAEGQAWAILMEAARFRFLSTSGSSTSP